VPGVRVTPGARTFLVTRIGGLGDFVGLVGPGRERLVADHEIPAGDP
jgi:hypothetical protein